MINSLDETYGGHDYDRSGSIDEQSDTDKEYKVDSNEESEESEEMEENEYSLDEESDAQIDIGEGDNSASGSDLEKLQLSNFDEQPDNLYLNNFCTCLFS
ncbi:hypothetical protein RYX36_005652 [Vicia faba]